MELFVNDAVTALAADIQAADTTLTVTSGAQFPATGNFRIRIDSEILLVTGVSGTTWNVTRAAEAVAGTQTAAQHLSGSPVYGVLTNMALNVITPQLPPGVVLFYPGFTLPPGCLWAHGQPVSRATYPNLFSYYKLTLSGNTTNGNTTIAGVSDLTKLFTGLALSGPGIVAPVTFTGNIAAGSATLTCSTAGLAVGMEIIDPAGNLPRCFIKAIGSGNITLGRFTLTLTNNSPNKGPGLVQNTFYSQVTANGNTYYAHPAITTSSFSGNTFVISNNAGQTATGQSLTFLPHGSGDGVTTFNVPDMRGRFPFGAGQNFANAFPGSAGPYPTTNPVGVTDDTMLTQSGDTLGASNAGSGFDVGGNLQLANIRTWPALLCGDWIVQT